MEKWYTQKGNEQDIVISSAVRLQRNFENYPFPLKLTYSDRKKVNESVRDVILSHNDFNLSFIEMESLTQTQALSLAEKNIITPEFAENPKGRALLLSESEAIGIMLCEEDHIRIQAVCSGLNLDKNYEMASKIDDVLDSEIGYAFDERIGYLTQCPVNLGTAMRASVVLHLPALSVSGSMGRLSKTVSKLGLTIRNYYINGITPIGNIFILSNQVTLGISEESALSNLKSIAMQLVFQERQARESIVNDEKIIDKILRAYGVLTSAYLMSSAEFTELASLVRLGAAMSITDADIMTIDALLKEMQPATVNAMHSADFTALERDKIRAKEIKEKICAK